MDCQGLNVLVRAHNVLSPAGRQLRLRSPRRQVRTVLEISGVASVLTLDG